MSNRKRGAAANVSVTPEPEVWPPQEYQDMFWEFLEEASAIEQEGSAAPDLYCMETTREGYKVSVMHSLDTMPLEYAENPWKPDEYPEIRCDTVVIGFNEKSHHKTIVLFPYGKDVHSIEMDDEQADRLGDMLKAYAKCVRESRRIFGK